MQTIRGVLNETSKHTVNLIGVSFLPDLSISHSTTQTFSDKLIMSHMSLLSASGIGNYATAAAASQRNDLAMNYERLSVEIAAFAKSGADIMINTAGLNSRQEQRIESN